MPSLLTESEKNKSTLLADINKDGIKEILMQRESGGNCCAPELSIIIFDKNCKISKLNFLKWNWVWGGWDDIVFQLSNNKVDLIALNDHQGMGVNELNQQKVTYRYDGGSISFVSLYETIQIEALVNLKSSFFSSDLMQEDQYIDFDLNGDQIKEEISCNYWYRWGLMTDCKVIIQDGTNILDVNRSTFNPKRLGILSEKKNGWNVLVVDYNERIIYDPIERIYKETK